jgi:predicted Fe-Mo cluster-binding NifX family protein
MRIGIPIWEDKVSPVLDTALKLQVVEVQNRRVASRTLYHMDEHDLKRRCARIRGLNIDIIICGAVSHPFLRLLMASGIDVIREISGSAEDILETYLKGDLFDSHFIMPWCKRNRRIRGPV